MDFMLFANAINSIFCPNALQYVQLLTKIGSIKNLFLGPATNPKGLP